MSSNNKSSSTIWPCRSGDRQPGKNSKQKASMNTNGKKARKETGMNRHELKRATRMKRHEHLGDTPYNPNIGTNARKAESRRALNRM